MKMNLVRNVEAFHPKSRVRKDIEIRFLVEKIFVPGEVVLTYTHNDRMIFGGVTPTDRALSIELSTEHGVSYFLERRELGVLNIGGSGSIRYRR
jgi:4-deoxy-L-threo-5-hexosulose-uronate ketol-isomerase